MYAPILEIDTRKIEENARKLHTFCALRGVELAFVTKGFSARPGVIRAARAGGVTRIADSRLKNIIAAKTAIPGLHYLLIRIPALVPACIPAKESSNTRLSEGDTCRSEAASK